MSRTFRLLAGILALLLAFGVLSTRANDASAFDAANRLYEQGRFQEAASAYEKVLSQGKVSSALYFNLGNARFKAGELGRAIAAYRNAEQLAPRDPDIRANLEFVRSQVQGPTASPSTSERWFRRFTLNEWTIATAVLLWIWLLLMAVLWLRRKPAVPRSIPTAGGAALVLLILCTLAAARDNSRAQAIVAVSAAAVHNGPFEESPKAFTVHDGAELDVLDQKDQWLQVTANKRQIGWIRSGDVVLRQNHLRAGRD